MRLVGAAQAGDDVVVNVEAVELGLGSGGADIVHVNLTRGLDGDGTPGAHVMKLNYTSLQHAVLPVEEGDPDTTPAAPRLPLDGAVAVLALHGQLAPLAWAFAQAGGGRLGYVQTAGGALPGGHSCVVRELLEGGLLAGHLTAGPAFGGADGDAITTAARCTTGSPRSPGTRRSPGRARGSWARARRSGMAACRRWTRRTPRSRSAAARCSSRACRAPTGARVTAGSAITRGRCSSCCWRRSSSRCPPARSPPTSATTGARRQPTSTGMGRADCRCARWDDPDPLFFAAALAAGATLAGMT